MGNPSVELNKILTAVCLEYFKKLGGDDQAQTWVLNGVMHSFMEWCARCTTDDLAVGQTRFNELSIDVVKVMQDFFVKYGGGVVVVDLPQSGKSRCAAGHPMLDDGGSCRICTGPPEGLEP